MLCRVADSLYWLFRYIERADNLVRFLDVAWGMALDSSGQSPSEWNSLIETCADRQLFTRLNSSSSAQAVIHFITREPENPNSILNCISVARENARQIREILPTELFEELNSLYLLLQEDPRFWQQPLPDQLQQISRSCQTMVGIQACTMQRDQSWLFATLGQLMERADKTARLLDVKYFLLLPQLEDVGGALDELQWIALLRSVGGNQMFRRQQRSDISPAQVAQFLLLNPAFPRSVRYCIEQMMQVITAIQQINGPATSPELSTDLEKLNHFWANACINDLINSGLHEAIDSLQIQLNTIHGQLQASYFTTPPCTSGFAIN